MEMFVIGVIALIAFAVVLLPLFRRGDTASADQREFEGAPDDETPAAAIPPIAAGPATPIAGVADVDAEPAMSADAIELEVQRYRTALRAGTLCPKCGQANPAGSAFCFECGGRLPLADAKEFE